MLTFTTFAILDTIQRTEKNTFEILFFFDNLKNNGFRAYVCIEDEWETGYCGQFGTNFKAVALLVFEICVFLAF